jgi:type VI secretion system secreted protein Hcp
MPETKPKAGLGSLVVRPLLAGMVAAGAVAPVAAPAADDIFLKIDGIQGDSTDAKHAKEIVLLSYSQSFSHATATGGPAGKTSCGSVNVTKLIDKSSPDLIGLVVTSKLAAKAVISFRTVGTKTTFDYYTVTLTDVMFDSISQSDAAGGGTIFETLSMKPATFKFELRVQNPDGSLGPGSTFGWDCAKGAKL